jgi:hypothetical protein
MTPTTTHSAVLLTLLSFIDGAGREVPNNEAGLTW